MSRSFLLLSASFYIFLNITDLQAQALGTVSSDLIKNADAIVRSEQMIVTIEDRESLTWEVERMVTVLNPNGNGHIRPVVHYNNDRKIKDLSLEVFDASGKEIEKHKIRDFKDVSAEDGITLYSDARIKYINYTPIAYPYTLRLKYTLQTTNSAYLPSWYFIKGYGVSTEKSEYIIRYVDPLFEPIIQENHLEKFGVVKLEQNGEKRYTAKQLKAIAAEALSPPFRKIVPGIRLRPVHFSYEGMSGRTDSWEEIGSWIYQNLLVGRDVLPESTKIMARQLVAGVEDPVEKARIIYQYVQDNTRYISVQVGIGGMQPISATDVDQVKYGDCKGLTNYTLALLKAVDVPAFYVHVESGRSTVDFDPEFPSIFDGDHVILAIQDADGYQWVDCTSQVQPFGFLGDFTDDRNVLLIAPDGGKLIKTPAYRDSLNFQRTEAEVVLNANGNLTGLVKRSSEGLQYDYNSGVLQKNHEEQIKHYREKWGYLGSLNLSEVQLDNNRESVSFGESLEIETKDYATFAGDRMLFAPNIFNRVTYIPERYRNRKLPFEIRKGYMDVESYRIRIPEGYEVEGLPAPVHFETPFGTYSMNIEPLIETGEILYARKLLIKAGKHSNDSYSDYREFRKKIASAESAKAVIKKL